MPDEVRVIRERWLEQVPEQRPRASVLAKQAGMDIAVLLGEIDLLRGRLACDVYMENLERRGVVGFSPREQDMKVENVRFWMEQADRRKDALREIRALLEVLADEPLPSKARNLMDRALGAAEEGRS